MRIKAYISGFAPLSLAGYVVASGNLFLYGWGRQDYPAVVWVALMIVSLAHFAYALNSTWSGRKHRIAMLMFDIASLGGYAVSILGAFFWLQQLMGIIAGVSHWPAVVAFIGFPIFVFFALFSTGGSQVVMKNGKAYINH